MLVGKELILINFLAPFKQSLASINKVTEKAEVKKLGGCSYQLSNSSIPSIYL